MNPQQETLPEEQWRVLRQLGPVAESLGFYLAGGTAVALHLGHRRSVDLDWFTPDIPDPLELAQEIQDRGVDLSVGSTHRRTLHGSVGGVRVSFRASRYPLLCPPVVRPEFGGSLAGLEDLAAMKLLAVSQRGSKKDFVDIHALGRHGLSLAAMLACYKQKFSVADIARVLFSLCYFDDADPAPMPFMLVPTTWEEVKASIRAWVKSLSP